MVETRDWSKLPTDLVSLITKKLPDLSDFIRVCAVCKNWASTPLSGCPPQLPWLLELDPLFPELEREQRFYCLSSGKTGTICVEESHHGKPFRGPCKGYLLLFHGQGESVRVSLFNPLTGAVISLPFIGIDFIWPVWISANRTTTEVMFVERNLFLPEERGKWAYHHPESNDWISVDGIFNNCCYLNGMFFSTERSENTKVFDVTSKTLLHEILPPLGEIAIPDSQILLSAYLVESCEEILRVSWYMKRRVEESVFHIHRLDFQGGKGCPRWIKITNIGDQIIFLEELNGFSICAKPFAGFRGNCIYFGHHLWLEKPHRYDIETGTVEIVPCPFEIGSWFIPSLQ